MIAENIITKVPQHEVFSTIKTFVGNDTYRSFRFELQDGLVNIYMVEAELIEIGGEADALSDPSA